MILFAGGLAGLILGAEALVRGASRLALALGMSPLAIGLTVVALGTSTPELAVAVSAAVGGKGDLAFGNVVGSNIANILLILGASALGAPLVVSRRLIQVDVPVVLAAALVAAFLAADGRVGRLDGVLLLAGFAGYTAFTLRTARAEAPSLAAPALGNVAEAVASRPHGTVLRNVTWIVSGLALLVIGSRWLVAAAVDVARGIGVSELVIGLTIVAAGTSLPEIATSLLAALRGERDIAVGNVMGSNILNTLAVLGLSSAVAPDGIAAAPAALRFDVPVMLAASLACLPIFVSGHRIDRWEGGVFLAYYVAYVAYLVLDATRHDALPVFSKTMLAFVLPLTIVTVLVVTLRETTARRERSWWRVGRR